MSDPLLHFDIFTIFPEMFPGPCDVSLLGRAREKGLWSLNTVNLRDYALDRHHSVDDTPYGGGAGMVMRPDVLDRALEAVYDHKRPTRLIYLSPRGRPFTQNIAKELAMCPQIGLLCGRFEGVDERLLRHWDFEEISLGDFVLTGGEMAAYPLIDATVRLLPGVVGDAASLEEESFSSPLLEYPQYTKPRVWKDLEVPPILLEGHHEKIRAWRQSQAEEVTRHRRPDLWQSYNKLPKDE